jgi:hypothetical protein
LYRERRVRLNQAMTISGSRVAVAATLAVTLVTGVLAGSASAHPIAKGSAQITKVTFSGSPKNPTITISGSGFGHRPSPNLPIPPYSAAKKYNSDCSKQRVAGNGKDGHDYAARSLGVGWSPQAPHGFSAGVYVPGQYLDCIGLKIIKYTPSRVVLRMGCQYKLYPKVKGGEKALVSVNGARARLTVHYHH